MLFRIIVICIFYLLFGHIAQASSKINLAYSIPSTDDTLEVDGALDEALWQGALSVPMNIETSPRENVRSPVNTTARIIRNHQFLFVSFIAEDSDPERIRATLRDRDSLLADDWVGIILDTFNDERRSYAFYVNPRGSQMDFIYNDVLKKEDRSWDTVWHSAGKMTSKGFQVEIAIPFKSIRYTESDDNVVWGINFIRNFPRDVQQRFSNNEVDRNKNCLLCQYEKFEGMTIEDDDSYGLEITPSLSVSTSESRDPGFSDWQSSGTEDELGVDLAWNINSENALSVTLNPDFSQVESDSLQLDVNTAFALYFPEKRTFFLESIDYFQTPIDTVFTRNIVDPDLGFKMTGKNNGHMYGSFWAEDTVTSFIVPGALSSGVGVIDDKGESFVGRYRYDIGEASTIGLLTTNRKSGDYYNDLVAIDGRYAINEQQSITYQLMQSDTQYPDELATDLGQQLGSFDGDGLFVKYEYRDRDWQHFLRYRNYSDGLRADMGFLSRVGYDRLEFYSNRFLYGDENNWWNKIRLHVNWTITHDTDDRMIRRNNEAAIEIRGPMQSALYFNFANLSEYWDGELYDESFFEFYGEIRPTNDFILQLSAVVGDEIDFANSRLADTDNLAFWARYNFNEHFTVSTDFAFTELSSEGNRILSAYINDLRMSYQFDLQHRLELTLQHQSIDRNPAMYFDPVESVDKNLATRLVYSFKVNPRTVVYAGYSDNAIDNDQLTSLTKSDKTGFVKFSYSFDI